MIRSGMSRKLEAESLRAHLLTQWEAYPQAVRQLLNELLRGYGLQAAEFATKAIEQMRKSGGQLSGEQREVT